MQKTAEHKFLINYNKNFRDLCNDVSYAAAISVERGQNDWEVSRVL